MLQIHVDLLRTNKRTWRDPPTGPLPAHRRSPNQGAIVSTKSLTIVLPVYNNESQLAPCVGQMLDLASDLTSRFAIMIVDDGSTDDTSNVAQELAREVPAGVCPSSTAQKWPGADRQPRASANQIGRRHHARRRDADRPRAGAAAVAAERRPGFAGSRQLEARSRHPRPGHGPDDAQRDGHGSRAGDGLPYRGALDRGTNGGRRKSVTRSDGAAHDDIAPSPSRNLPAAREWARFRRCRGRISSPPSRSSRSANSCERRGRSCRATTCPVVAAQSRASSPPVSHLRCFAASAASLLLKHLTRPRKRCAELQRFANAFSIGTCAKKSGDNSLVPRDNPTYHNQCSRRVGTRT